MQINPLNETASIGAEIVGLDLKQDIGDAEINDLKNALWQHHVLVFRNQTADAGSLIKFARKIGVVEGPEASAALTTHDADHPEIQRLSYLRRDGSAPADTRPSQADSWHTDYSYLPDPPELGFLAAVELPPAGPDTLFLNMHHAFETLPEADKIDIAHRSAVHSQIGGLDPEQFRLPPYAEPGQVVDMASADRSATHPLVRVHKVSGRRALYLAQCYTVEIEGLLPEESEQRLAELYDHALGTGAIYRHVWRDGDCILWDNSMLNHKRSQPLDAPRVLSRLTIRIAP